MSTLAVLILCCTATYLIALGTAALIAPAVASRFLSGFATSARLHYLELALRLAVGGALLVHASAMPASSVWRILGWVLLATTAVLLLIPWRWHRDFAARSVPQALRFIKSLGVASGLAGGALLYATLAGWS